MGIHVDFLFFLPGFLSLSRTFLKFFLKIKMGFGDVSTEAGLKALNTFLEEHSYIEGFVPSQADVAVFDAAKKAPAKEKFPHAARWYAHILSFEAAGRKQFPKSQKAPESYLAAGGAAEDEEESEEAAKVREERLAAYAAKKSKKPALIAKTSVLLDVKPWDDETDMDEVLKSVKTIEMEGLVWGA